MNIKVKHLFLFTCNTLLCFYSNYTFSQTTFKPVKIGTQVWMTENLNVTTFRNGDTIPEAKSNLEWLKAGKAGTPAWCYYKNDASNGSKYGKLYNWYAINDKRGLAPKGWHIPTDNEFKILLQNLGGMIDAGKKLKNTEGWDLQGNGDNSSGFSFLPAGFRFSDVGDGDFNALTQFGYVWTSTEVAIDKAVDYELNDQNSFVSPGQPNKATGFSCRCILGELQQNNDTAKRDNLKPMYGEIPQSEAYKKIDEDFIGSAVALSGSREKASESFIKKSWAYLYHDSIDLAMRRFNQAWLLNPDNPDSYFGFAAITEIRRGIPEAERYFKMGLDKDTGKKRAEICYKRVADCTEQLQYYNGTIDAYERIVAMDAGNIFAFKKLGYFYTQTGNQNKALNSYNKAIELDPKDSLTYVNRGCLYQTQKKDSLAIADFSYAISLDPKYIRAYVNRGLTKMDLGDNAGAKKDFEISASLDSQSGQLRRLLGLAKLNLKDNKGACDDFDKAKKLGDPEADTLIEKNCK
jgi:uncharacterized protein (TIGR02145 family)